MKALPNIISIFRICLVPVFIFAFMLDVSDVKIIAICIFVIANASDILDGYIARKYDAQSKLGKILDPLGDKLIIFAALICIATIRNSITWVAAVYFIKEILMGVGGFLIGRRGITEIPPSNCLGKTTTVFFFSVCAVLMIFPNIPDTLGIIFMSLAICLALAAFINYLSIFIRLMKSATVPINVNENDGESV